MQRRTGSRSHDSPRSERRRDLLRRALFLACAGGIAAADGRVFGAPPPKETGLSFEGLFNGEPGFQPREPAPLPIREIPGFLSREQLARNYDVYREAFAALLAAEKGLRSVGRGPDAAEEYASLRRREIESANSVLLHELYFHNLASAPVEPSRYVLGNMSEHMGTMETWREDFAACARVATGWAVLVYDPYDDRWHNLPLDESAAGGMAGNNPLVVCDVAEDAWSVDYEDREKYVARFLDHVDWEAVAKRYRAVDRR
jgi:Fe-Mn family superoxide dismutase